MLLTLKSEDVTIKDDKNQEIKPQTMQESNEVVLRPENPAAEINLNFDAPARSATKLSVFRVKSEVTTTRRHQGLPLPQPGPGECHAQAGRCERNAAERRDR